MLEEIVESLKLSNTQKILYMKMAKEFELGLPDSLYQNPYELTEELHGSVNEWKKFLKIPEVNRYIEGEMAMIAEIAARHSLKKLQGSASSQDIQAAKELLSSSKLLKQKTGQHQQFVLTRIPAKEEK